ncbi:Exosome complex component ski6 [Verticillium dahliae VDG1]|nr:Exosome complex component ski6 [Verticillium dahliae VDG1]
MLRWGILGTGFISHTVAKAIENSTGSTIQAIFGRNPDNLRAFADKYNVASRYDTLESILGDDEVDVVYIGLASHVHAEAIIAAAKRGKAILSEKPLTTTLADAKASLDAVRDANVFMLEGLMYLCHPFMEKVVEIVRSGELGSIRAINGHDAAQIWDRANPLGKGTIYNLGCYPVSLLHLIVQTAFGPDAIRSRTLQAAGNVSHDGGGDKAVMTFKTNPWLPVAGDNVLTIETYKTGETREVVVTASEDAFACQVKKVEEALAAGHKEAKRPAARLSDSLEIMELLIEWEEKILGQAP